jgi:hypothetical protein
MSRDTIHLFPWNFQGLQRDIPLHVFQILTIIKASTPRKDCVKNTGINIKRFSYSVDWPLVEKGRLYEHNKMTREN